jgi:hypothetical protein
MAPLAGLEDRPLAPIMSRVGNLLFERGEEIYNFQGVRKYKDKYDPTLAAALHLPPRTSGRFPLLMADVGLLSSGGMSGLAKRPKRRQAPPSSVETPSVDLTAVPWSRPEGSPGGPASAESPPPPSP